MFVLLELPDGHPIHTVHNNHIYVIDDRPAKVKSRSKLSACNKVMRRFVVTHGKLDNNLLVSIIEGGNVRSSGGILQVHKS